jgi:hypothetical protein
MLFLAKERSKTSFEVVPEIAFEHCDQLFSQEDRRDYMSKVKEPMDPSRCSSQ